MLITGLKHIIGNGNIFHSEDQSAVPIVDFTSDSDLSCQIYTPEEVTGTGSIRGGEYVKTLTPQTKAFQLVDGVISWDSFGGLKEFALDVRGNYNPVVEGQTIRFYIKGIWEFTGIIDQIIPATVSKAPIKIKGIGFMEQLKREEEIDIVFDDRWDEAIGKIGDLLVGKKYFKGRGIITRGQTAFSSTSTVSRTYEETSMHEILKDFQKDGYEMLEGVEVLGEGPDEIYPMIWFDKEGKLNAYGYQKLDLYSKGIFAGYTFVDYDKKEDSSKIVNKVRIIKKLVGGGTQNMGTFSNNDSIFKYGIKFERIYRESDFDASQAEVIADAILKDRAEEKILIKTSEQPYEDYLKNGYYKVTIKDVVKQKIIPGIYDEGNWTPPTGVFGDGTVNIFGENLGAYSSLNGKFYLTLQKGTRTRSGAFSFTSMPQEFFSKISMTVKLSEIANIDIEIGSTATKTFENVPADQWVTLTVDLDDLTFPDDNRLFSEISIIPYIDQPDPTPNLPVDELVIDSIYLMGGEWETHILPVRRRQYRYANNKILLSSEYGEEVKDLLDIINEVDSKADKALNMNS